MPEPHPKPTDNHLPRWTEMLPWFGGSAMVWRYTTTAGWRPKTARAMPLLKPQGLLTYWFLFYNVPWELVSLLQKSDALNKYTPCPFPHSLTKKPKKNNNNKPQIS